MTGPHGRVPRLFMRFWSVPTEPTLTSTEQPANRSAAMNTN